MIIIIIITLRKATIYYQSREKERKRDWRTNRTRSKLPENCLKNWMPETKRELGYKLKLLYQKSAEFMHTKRYCNKKEERQDKIEERPSNEMVAGVDNGFINGFILDIWLRPQTKWRKDGEEGKRGREKESNAKNATCTLSIWAVVWAFDRMGQAKRILIDATDCRLKRRDWREQTEESREKTRTHLHIRIAPWAVTSTLQFIITRHN